MSNILTLPTTHTAGDHPSRIMRTNSRLIELIQSRLKDSFAQAVSWPDLMARLSSKGIDLRDLGGRLGLVSLNSGARLCYLQDIGYASEALAAQLGGPFPRLVPPSPFSKPHGPKARRFVRHSELRPSEDCPTRTTGSVHFRQSHPAECGL